MVIMILLMRPLLIMIELAGRDHDQEQDQDQERIVVSRRDATLLTARLGLGGRGFAFRCCRLFRARLFLGKLKTDFAVLQLQMSGERPAFF